MKIAVLNVTFQLKPTLEPLGTEQAICVFEEAGFETLFYASSLHGAFDDEFAVRVMACDGVMFAGISNVRDILDQFYERRDEIASALRAKGYEGFIVATGHQASLRPEETLAACSAIDAVIVGDPDAAAREMVDRLQKGLCTLGQGFVFNDLLTNYERVADHCSNIAVAMIELESDSFDTHEYINSVMAMHSHSFDEYYAEYSKEFQI